MIENQIIFFCTMLTIFYAYDEHELVVKHLIRIRAVIQNIRTL